jgi:starvation-inducible DNA-binding protein
MGHGTTKVKFEACARGVINFARYRYGSSHGGAEEHIVQLGGMAEGTAQAVARRSSLDEYRLSIADGNGHIDALSTTLAAFGRHARYASEQATELKDADTADIFKEVARGIDTWLWFVETSQQSGS